MDDQWSAGCNYEKMRTILKFLKRTNYATSIQWMRKTQGKISLFVFNVSTWKDFEDTLFVGKLQNSIHNKIFYKKKTNTFL